MVAQGARLPTARLRGLDPLPHGTTPAHMASLVIVEVTIFGIHHQGDDDDQPLCKCDQELFHYDMTSTNHTNLTIGETAKATACCLAQECSLAVKGSMAPRPGVGATPPPESPGSETEGLRGGRTRIGVAWRRRRVHRSSFLAKRCS